MRRGRLAYVRVPPDERFWSEHWEAETFAHLEAVARVSPLSRWLEARIAAGDRMLEAGCGLGQYVRHFGQRGVDVTGVDFAASAIERHRLQFPDSDVRVADLERLPFGDGEFDVYLSVGVIEHYEVDPGPLLREARRVLAGDGRLLLSTPYLSWSRKLLRPAIERRQRQARAHGARFYQWAFDERALEAILAEHGFRVVERGRYDPGRGLRDVRDLVRGTRPAAPAEKPAAPRAPVEHGPLKRRLLYARPTLKTLAHMQIVHARKA